MTTPRVRCPLCRRLVLPLLDGRYPVHGPRAERCRAGERQPEEVRATARRNAVRSKRGDWSRMHARGSAAKGWRYKQRFDSLQQAREAAEVANAEPGTTTPLQPYPCKWKDAPPPIAEQEVTWHYHIGRGSIDAPTQPG